MNSALVTERQLQVLHFVEQYIRQHGCSPSLRDIGDALGHVGRLVKKKLLTYQPNRIRTIALVKSKRR
jgi:SOS-response transcriptional repressor LexA